MDTLQMSGGVILILGIIIAIVIVFIPAFIYIYAWLERDIPYYRRTCLLINRRIIQIIRSEYLKISYFF
jgi:hypothetical protein